MANPFMDAFQAALQSQNSLDQGRSQAISQAAGLQGLLAKVQAQQEQQKLNGLLQQSGGDPAKAVQALIAAGTPQAIEMASKLKGMMPRPAEPYTLSPGGQRRGPNNELLAEAPMRPANEQAPSNIARLYKEMAQIPAGDPRRATYINAIRKESETARQISPTIVMPRQQPQPLQITDPSGNVKLYDREGNLIKDLGAVGKPSTSFDKAAAAKRKSLAEIETAISELKKATADGGLIDKSTGSGAGALVDMGAAFVGQATPGAIAVGQMKPIYDLILKMVPRFEGPQSDKDTRLYERAAGELANPAVPNTQKKAAGKEILRLMEARRGQFMDKSVAGTEADIVAPYDGPDRRGSDEPPPGAVRRR